MFKEFANAFLNEFKSIENGFTFQRIGNGETDFIKNNNTVYVAISPTNIIFESGTKIITVEFYVSKTDSLNKYEREERAEEIADLILQKCINLGCIEVKAYEPITYNDTKKEYSLFLVACNFPIQIQ